MFLKSQLKRHIISTLYFEKTLSVVELSAIIGKSVPHTTKALSELAEEGLIMEKWFCFFQRGKKAQSVFIEGRHYVHNSCGHGSVVFENYHYRFTE